MNGVRSIVSRGRRMLSGFIALGAVVVAASFPSVAAPSRSEAVPGTPAPGFQLVDSKGNAHSLSDFRGKFVVLEWVNYECPFVGKHYRSGNMQSLQKEYTAKGVVWLSICSSAPGRQGYYHGPELTERIAAMKAVPTDYLVDAGGEVGQMYGAKATPTMAVIDPKGMLLYEGGIDDIASTDVEDIPRAHNYLREVLDAALAGKPVPISSSRAYGCSVKYK